MARARREPRRTSGGTSACRRIRALPTWRSTIERVYERTEWLRVAQSVELRVNRGRKLPTQTPHTPKRKGRFPFLKLPRELRDQIYRFMFCVNNDRTHDSITLQAKYNASPSVAVHRVLRSKNFSRWHRSRTALLCANRQTHTEGLQAIYKRQIFCIHVDAHAPVFASRAHKTEYDPKRALPLGWNLAFITELVLHIDLGLSGKTYVALTQLDFSLMKNMESLRKLTLAMTMWRIRMSWREPIAEPNESKFSAARYVNRMGRKDQGTRLFREMVKRLLGSLPGEVRELQLVSDSSWDLLGSYTAKDSIQVDGKFLGSIIEDLRDKFKGSRLENLRRMHVCVA